MLEAARNGNEEKLAALLTPLNVNCHAEDGRKSTPLHLAAGYNRTRIVQLLLKYGADVQAKDKGLVDLQTPGMLFCSDTYFLHSHIKKFAILYPLQNCS